MSDANLTLTLLGRYGCHLCEEMRTALDVWAERFSFAVREVDITGNKELESRYGQEIPVLLSGNQVICSHFLDEQALQVWLSESKYFL